MPTVVPYLQSNAFKAKDNGDPREGELFNTHTSLWEDLDAKKKETLLGFERGDTGAPSITGDNAHPARKGIGRQYHVLVGCIPERQPDIGIRPHRA